MSGKAVGWAFEQSDLTPTQRLVLVALADNATSDGECWPGQRHLAAKTGLGLSTVREALKHIEALKLLSRTPRQRRDGRGRTSDLYQLALDQPPAAEGGQPPAHGTTNRQLTTDQPPGAGGQGTVREPSERTETPSGEGNGNEWAEWLEHYRETTGKRDVRGSKSARRAFLARRRDDYTLDDLKAATVGCHGDEFCRDRGFNVPDTILRPSNVDRYIELSKSKPTARRSSGSIASIRREDDVDYGSTLEKPRRADRA